MIKNFIKFVFSVTNENAKQNKVYKVFKFIGIKFKFRNYKAENRKLLSSDYSNEGIMVKDDKGNNFDINSIEINEEDLIVNAKQSKELNLRFLRSYSTATESDEIIFNNIVKNYDDFVNNRDEYNDTIQIKVDL